MNPKEYVKNVLITEARDMAPLQERFSKVRAIRLLHGAIGLASELSEVRDMARREIDTVNLKEEMGDICWYMGIIVDELQLDPDSIFESKPINATSTGPEHSLRNDLNVDIDDLTINIGILIDMLKKNLMYGKELNIEVIRANLVSIGCSVESALNIFGMTSSEARERNIEKLRARYGDKFTEAAALERNLEAERTILEKK